MPIEKKEIDDKTIAEIWGPGADKPEDKPTDKPADKPEDKPSDKPEDKPTLDKETYDKAVAAQGRIEKVMEKHGFEEFDELVDALQDSQKLRDELGNRDLKQLIKDADYLDTLTRWQADQVTKKDVEDEETDEKVARLERELKEFKTQQQKEKDEEAQRKESAQAISDYNELVTSTLENQEIPKEHRPFVAALLAVDNPMLDVDLDNKVAVRKALKGQLKVYNGLVNAIIKDYREGKVKIPDITPTDTNPPEPPAKVKDLKHARSIAAEILSGKIFKH